VAAARAELGAQVADDVDAVLEWVQQRLMDCCTAVASPTDVLAVPNAPQPVIATWAPLLEGHIDRWTATLPPLWAFIVPYGGRRCSAALHVCRTVCRRAERRVVDVADTLTPPVTRYEQEVRAVGVFVNRMSDFLFTAARLVSASEVERDVKVPT
jgi:ATP:cob(I)alamin adenosyltransferase